MIEAISNIWKLIAEIVRSNNFSTLAGERLYAVSKTLLGSDPSPEDRAPDDYACAESVNMVFKKAFGEEIGGTVSTARMYEALKNSPRFIKVFSPRRGDVYISPTGWGNGKLPNGHVGIVHDNGRIASNNSYNGMWEEKYTYETWKARYVKVGGFPVYIFRPIR